MQKLSLVLAMVFFAITTMMAQRSVSGIVSDEKGETLIGASILVKGTTSGTVTDIDGKYTLNVPDGSTTLIFSYTGFAPLEVELGASNVLDVTLREGVTLETAVVTALGVKRDEKAVGYAVQQVDGDAIERANTVSAIDALRGKAAGVNVVRSSGAAGGGSRIVIRGQTSLTGNNQALIVVDGVRINNNTYYTEAGGNNPVSGTAAGVAQSNRGMDINPADIESVNVLKGAAATALYGVDGANGVVVITTKRGAKGKGFRVTAGFNVTFDEITNMPELQSIYAQGTGGEYRDPSTGSSTSWGPLVTDLAWDGSSDNPYDPNGFVVPANDPSASIPMTPYDPVADFFQTGSTYNTNFAVSGGDDKANFRFSFSDMRQEGIIPKNTYDRQTYKLVSDLKLTDKISVAASANYTRSDARRIQQGSNTSGLLLGMLRTPPSFDNANGVSDPINDEAAYVLPAGGQRNYRGGGGYDNPYWIINNAPGFDDVNRFFGSLRIDYNMHQWANLALNVGTDTYSDNRRQEFEIGSRTASGGRIIEDQYFFRNIDSYLNLSGNGEIASGFNFGYLIGVNIFDEKLNRLYSEGNGLSFSGFRHITNASEVVTDNDDRNLRNIGFYANLDFSYKDFLYLSLTGRQDYVSTLIVPGAFNAGDISFFYPSANLGFVFSELMPENDIFSFGKLRLSYAQVGGGAPNPYGTSTPFLIASADDGWGDGINWPFLGTTGFRQGNRLGNPNLIPEKTVTYEAGIDLRFFKGRLGLDVTYYTSESQDQIVPVDLPGTTGYVDAFLNSGSDYFRRC